MSELKGEFLFPSFSDTKMIKYIFPRLRRLPTVVSQTEIVMLKISPSTGYFFLDGIASKASVVNMKYSYESIFEIIYNILPGYMQDILA